MYYTKEDIVAMIPTLTEAQATSYGNIVSKVIDNYVGYKLTDGVRKIVFDISEPVKKVSLPFGKVKSIISTTLDSDVIGVKSYYDNYVEFNEVITSGELYIEVTAGHGVDSDDIDGLSDAFYGMVQYLVELQKSISNTGNVSTITIGELSKSYTNANSKALLDKTAQPLQETLTTMYADLLDPYKYIFAFDNTRHLVS